MITQDHPSSICPRASSFHTTFHFESRVVLNHWNEPTVTQLCKVLVQQLLSCQLGEVIIIKGIPRGDIGRVIDILLGGPWGTRGCGGSRSGCDHPNQTTVINNPSKILWPALRAGPSSCIIITSYLKNSAQIIGLHAQKAGTN